MRLIGAHTEFSPGGGGAKKVFELNFNHMQQNSLLFEENLDLTKRRKSMPPPPCPTFVNGTLMPSDGAPFETYVCQDLA